METIGLSGNGLRLCLLCFFRGFLLLRQGLPTDIRQEVMKSAGVGFRFRVYEVEDGSNLPCNTLNPKRPATGGDQPSSWPLRPLGGTFLVLREP